MQVRQHMWMLLAGLFLAGCGAAAAPVAVFEGAVVPTRQPTPEVRVAATGELGFVFPAVVGGEISLGDDVSGFIDADNYAHSYRFEGLAGQRIDVSMGGEGTLDTYLILIGPNGREIARNDDRSPTSRDAQLRNIDLEESGTYTVVAAVWRQRYTLDSGNFRLEITEAQPGDSSATPRTKFISYGVTQFEDISDRSFWDAYTFLGEAGDVVDISMFAEDGENPDASLALTDGYGNEIAHNEDINPLSTFDAAIFDYVLPYTGYYTVIATRYAGKEGTTEGNYELTVDLVDQIETDDTVVAYRDANQSVSIFDGPNMGLRDFGYFVGDTIEINMDEVEQIDIPIQTILTFYLPPTAEGVAAATLDLVDCDTLGTDFEAIGPINIYHDVIDGRINSDTPYAPSDEAELLGQIEDCDVLDITGFIENSYEMGVERVQFRLIPETNAVNDLEDMVVFLNPRIEIELKP